MIAELTARVICDVLQEYFPVLRPQVEVNNSCPACWNKDGDGDVIENLIGSLSNFAAIQILGCDKEVQPTNSCVGE